MYIYYYFIILLDVCVSYDTRFDTMHDTKKSKIDLRYDSQFDNYACMDKLDLFIEQCPQKNTI